MNINRKYLKLSILMMMVISVSISFCFSRAKGEVKPIEEAEEKLQGISEQEKQTLEKLFLITQEIEEMERREARIGEEIEELTLEIEKLDINIKKEQENYDSYLSLLKQVLVSYQRGGPASYIDIILKAEDLTSLIKSLNLIKDISRNTGELLASIEESKLYLEQQRQNLSDSKIKLEAKHEELKISITEKQNRVAELESFLDSLAEEKELFEEHLNNLKLMWENSKKLFSAIVDEYARIISEGHFQSEDLNLEFSLFSLTLKGFINEDVFNKRINDNSNLSEMIFHFEKEGIRLEVPDNKLVLIGDFEIREGTALEFVPREGTFYDMALEKESIQELFKTRPMLIDFETVAGDMIYMNFELKEVYSQDGNVYFTINTDFFF